MLLLINTVEAKDFKISKEELLDKIKGAWATQVIGVTFGGPTEFRYCGPALHLRGQITRKSQKKKKDS